MRCNLLRLLARKNTKRIHSSKPASLNRPTASTCWGKEEPFSDGSASLALGGQSNSYINTHKWMQGAFKLLTDFLLTLLHTIWIPLSALMFSQSWTVHLAPQVSVSSVGCSSSAGSVDSPNAVQQDFFFFFNPPEERVFVSVSLSLSLSLPHTC